MTAWTVKPTSGSQASCCAIICNRNAPVPCKHEPDKIVHVGCGVVSSSLVQFVAVIRWSTSVAHKTRAIPDIYIVCHTFSTDGNSDGGLIACFCRNVQVLWEGNIVDLLVEHCSLLQYIIA